MNGPFGEAALELRRRNLAPLPLGGSDGKRPLVKFKEWTEPQPIAEVERAIWLFRNKNIGIVCGPSKITIVDCDDPMQAEVLISRFGPTPLVAETPSGGLHFYYRNDGERCRNLRPEGLSADVKGRGGQIVVAPSIRPNGRFAGRPYRIVEGSWNDLSRLPKILSGSLPIKRSLQSNLSCGTSDPASINEGFRNDWLFRIIMQTAAREAHTYSELLDIALLKNSRFPLPLTIDDVMKISTSVWNYTVAGRNWCGGSANIQVSAGESLVLWARPDALALLVRLRHAHGSEPGSIFAISTTAMAKGGAFAPWDRRRIERARDVLIDHQFVWCLHKGGAFRGDASRFVLSGKPTEMLDNITNTPFLPLAPLAPLIDCLEGNDSEGDFDKVSPAASDR